MTGTANRSRNAGSRLSRTRAPYRILAPLLVLTVLSATEGPTAAEATGGSLTFPKTASFDACHDQFNAVLVPIDRLQPMVPDDYTVSPVFGAGPVGEIDLSELRCDRVTIGDTVVHGVSLAFANVPLTGAPKGSPDDPNIGDGYLLFVTTNSKPLFNWLRAGTGLEAYYVPGIHHDYTVPSEPFGAASFSFAAPEPVKWAFSVDGTASAQHQTPVLIEEGLAWQDAKTPDGKTWRIQIAVLEHNNKLAPAEVAITAGPGSQMEKIMVTNPTAPALAVSGLIDHWDAVKTREQSSSPNPTHPRLRTSVLADAIPFIRDFE